ncbi:calcium-binding protein [Nitrosomonas sp.]|uniref:calcium-binding protein n=1 Tax=Nitrosomonas sp. TaxID=42353 RepID=UPI0025F12061|nr:calcium-binding protein [Nitrosomonas sp.]MBY0485555.1 calcium-binding protein [Nitrosomonas sp.]
MTTYIGTNGNDTLIGLDDVADDLTGKLGNDVLIGGDGKGFDWALYTDAPSAVTVNLAAGIASGGDGKDILNGIEGISGSKYNDTLIGDANNNTLRGNKGNDTLIGGDGFDSADYSDATAAVMVNLVTSTSSGGDGNDILGGIESTIGSNFNDTLIGGNIDGSSLYGGSGNDKLIGGDGNYITLDGGEGNDSLVSGSGTDNWLYGGSGNDSVVGGEGNDSLFGGLGSDLLIGGNGWGTDRVHYWNASSAVTVNLATGSASGGEGNDILKGIEGITGSYYNDILIGDDNNNFFEGIVGKDTIVGGLGDDYLWGGEDNDVLVGGDGNDYLDGGTENDSLDGGDGDDQLVGGLGTDILTGGKGFDWANYTDAFSSITVNLATGLASGGSGNDTLSEIEGVIGSNENDKLTGNANDNTLNGGWGDDVLMGGLGNDTLLGDKGFDWASYSDAASAVTVDLALGTASGGSGDDALSGIEAVIGSKFGDTLTGDANDNTLKGGAGNDMLDGKEGFNTLIGGSGNDIFKFTTTGHIDTINDYNVANDTIQLENAVFTALKTTGTLGAGQFRIGTQAVDANDFIIYNNATGELLYDADGNGTSAAIQVAAVGVGLSMTNADIVVI